MPVVGSADGFFAALAAVRTAMGAVRARVANRPGKWMPNPEGAASSRWGTAARIRPRGLSRNCLESGEGSGPGHLSGRRALAHDRGRVPLPATRAPPEPE